MAEDTRRLAEELLVQLATARLLNDLSGNELELLEYKATYVVSALRSLRNMKTPVHRLPPEVLALIFSKLVEIETPQSFVPKVLMIYSSSNGSIRSVSCVSRAWRKAALGFPVLWATISTSSFRKAMQSLTNSGDTDLSVFIPVSGCLWSGFEQSIQRESPSPFMDALAERAPRLKQLHLVSADERILRSATLMETPLPFLNSLSLIIDASSQRDSWSSDQASRWLPNSIFGGSTPRLREVTLIHCPPLPSQGFSGLSRLFIAQSNGIHTLSQILGVLSSSPQLEDLGLICIELDDDAQSREPISLNHLRVLALGRWGNSPVSCTHFLKHLVIPHPVELFLWGGRLASEIKLPTIFPLYRTVQAEDIQVLRITAPPRGRSRHRNSASPKIWRRSCFYSVISNKSELQVDGSFEPSQFLLSAPTLLNLCAVQELWLGAAYTTQPSLEEWRAFFASLPSLVTLVISRPPSYHIISALTLPENEHPRPLLFCPKLRTLRIFADESLSVLRLSIFFEQRDRLGRRLALFELISNGKTMFVEDIGPPPTYHPSSSPPPKPLWSAALVADLKALEEYVDKVDCTQIERDRFWDILHTSAMDWLHRLWSS